MLLSRALSSDCLDPSDGVNYLVLKNGFRVEVQGTGLGLRLPRNHEMMLVNRHF